MPGGKMWMLFHSRWEALKALFLRRDVTRSQHIRFFPLPKCKKKSTSLIASEFGQGGGVVSDKCINLQ